MSDAQQIAKRWPITLFITNITGACAYVALASRGWIIPQERAAGVHSVTGEPFVWFVAIFPVVVLFLLLNISWGTFIIIRRRWVSGRFWLAAATIWLIAVAIDFAHH